MINDRRHHQLITPKICVACFIFAKYLVAVYSLINIACLKLNKTLIKSKLDPVGVCKTSKTQCLTKQFISALPPRKIYGVASTLLKFLVNFMQTLQFYYVFHILRQTLLEFFSFSTVYPKSYVAR